MNWNHSNVTWLTLASYYMLIGKMLLTLHLTRVKSWMANDCSKTDTLLYISKTLQASKAFLDPDIRTEEQTAAQFLLLRTGDAFADC